MKREQQQTQLPRMEHEMASWVQISQISPTILHLIFSIGGSITYLLASWHATTLIVCCCPTATSQSLLINQARHERRAPHCDSSTSYVELLLSLAIEDVVVDVVDDALETHKRSTPKYRLSEKIV